jgi:hypothetical protein
VFIGILQKRMNDISLFVEHLAGFKKNRSLVIKTDLDRAFHDITEQFAIVCV